MGKTGKAFQNLENMGFPMRTACVTCFFNQNVHTTKMMLVGCTIPSIPGSSWINPVFITYPGINAAVLSWIKKQNTKRGPLLFHQEVSPTQARCSVETDTTKSIEFPTFAWRVATTPS